MRKMTFIFASLISFVLAACANSASRPAPVKLVKTPRVLEQEKKLREREQVRQDREDRERILNKKAQLQGSALPSRVVPQNKRIEISGDTHVKATSDRQLYAELVGSFDRNNEIAFFSRFQAFQERYSKSPLVDDAVYLAGLMSLSNKNYGPALRYLNMVLKKYPTSNKASSALFAKGVVLKKMNLMDDAKMAFQKVRSAYPGSPEALRADAELKILVK